MPRELLEVLFEQRLEREHRARADDRRRLAPAGNAFGRGRHRGVDVARGRERRARDHLAARRVVDVERLGARRRHPAAADEIREQLDGRIIVGPRARLSSDSASDRGPEPVQVQPTNRVRAGRQQR